MNSSQSGKKLAKKMIIALICGLIAGFGCILLRKFINEWAGSFMEYNQ